jgi:hypothetical protein
MLRPSIVWSDAAALALCLSTGVAVVPAAAQGPPPDLASLAALASPAVYVEDTGGVERFGQLVRVDPDALVLLVNGAQVRIPATGIARVRTRGDSLRNGALIGAGIGATLGVYSARFLCDGCVGQQVAFTIYSTAIYAAIGTAFDALHTGRRTVYRRPRSVASVRLGVGGGPRGEPAVHAGLAVGW